MIAVLVAAAAMQPSAPVDDQQELACYQHGASEKARERCDKEALQRAEQELGVFWDNTLAEYDRSYPTSRKLLIGAQANWLKYRDAWCDVVARDNHGSNPSTKAACQARLTRQRTQVIKDLIEGTNE